MTTIPKPPQIKVNLKSEEIVGKGFLSIRRSTISLSNNDEESEDFVVDSVIRKNPDAVVVVPYIQKRKSISVYLRSAIRPAVALANENEGNFWELPAGLIDEDEMPADAAARELFEEVGFDRGPQHMYSLGIPSNAAVGLTAEKIHFYATDVSDCIQYIPKLDGSHMEKYGALYIADLLKLIENDFVLKDMKTELGLNRFVREIYKGTFGTKLSDVLMNSAHDFCSN